VTVRSEGAVNSTKLIRESRPSRCLAEHRSDLSKLRFLPPSLCSVLRYVPMAVLLITYKYNPDRSKADHKGFYKVIRSFRWVKLSEFNYAITADAPAKAVWQKLKTHIDPDDYLVMLVFKSGTWGLKDQKVLAWLSDQPLQIEP
jgi:hypothetical protein